MKNVLFLGCGKMGAVIAKNLLQKKHKELLEIKVLKPSKKNKISDIDYVKSLNEFPKNYHADLVFIAIKPQTAKEVLDEFSQANIFHKNTIFVSILAGKKIDFFEKFFGKEAKIIRSMPNLPIQYSQGIFPFFSNKNLSKTEIKKLNKIFTNFGAAFEIKNENLFDAITAIFGSGPAYIFLLQQIFSEIAVKNKIDKKVADILVKKLFLGTALMSELAQDNFLELQTSVTSKGGTTEAGLKILQKKSALKKLFKKTIESAITRSKEISKQ